MKPEEALKELSYDDTAYGGNVLTKSERLRLTHWKSRFRKSLNIKSS